MAKQRPGWQAFWDRGGFWKAVLVAGVYWLAYQGVAWVVHSLWGGLINPDGILADPQSVFFGQTLSILLAGVLVSAFAWSIGWLSELFGPQPIGGSWWMWLAVVVVVGFNLVRFAAVDYAAVGLGVTVMALFLGLCIGFTEELVTRGLAVTLLRRRGYNEWVVMVLSSLIFAALHAGNFLRGGEPLALAVTLLYTFAFGLAMYLVLRATGNLIWPMLVHASTDPSLLLLTGAIGKAGQIGEPGPLLPIANLSNPAVILFALLPLIFVRGRVGQKMHTMPAPGEDAAT